MKNNLTVLVCVHSNNDYHDTLLLNALDSLENQSYKDFKTLIIFDECWSYTKNKIDRKNYNFNYDSLIREKREGLAYAKNFGLNHIDTEWVCFLDADDLLLPDKILKQVEYITHNDVDFLGTLAWNINGMDDKNLFPYSSFVVGQYETHDDIKNIITNQNVLVHGSMMIRKSCLNKLGGYHHKIGWEDWDLWQRAINNGFKFYQIQERLYIHRLGTSVIR